MGLIVLKLLKNHLMNLFLMGCFPGTVQERKQPISNAEVDITALSYVDSTILLGPADEVAEALSHLPDLPHKQTERYPVGPPENHCSARQTAGQPSLASGCLGFSPPTNSCQDFASLGCFACHREAQL